MREENREVARLKVDLAEAKRRLGNKQEKNVSLRGKNAALRKRLEEAEDQLARVAEAARRPARGSVPMFFLVGRGRSGTTWLRDILNSHPEILCLGEGYLLDRNFRKEEFVKLHHRISPSSLHNALAESEYLRLWIERSIWAGPEDVEKHLDSLTRLAVQHFMADKLSESGKKIVGDKTPFVSAKALYELRVHEEGAPDAPPHNGAVVLEEIARLLPGAKAVNLTRDGRDVAVSLMRFMWKRPVGERRGIYHLLPEEFERRDDPSARGMFAEKRLRAIAKGWASEALEAVRLGPRVLAEDFHDMRYEELAARPEVELGRVLRFLGADASPGALEASLRGAGDRWLTRQATDNWRTVFTERDKEIFKEEAGDALIELGYEKDSAW